MQNTYRSMTANMIEAMQKPSTDLHPVVTIDGERFTVRRGAVETPNGQQNVLILDASAGHRIVLRRSNAPDNPEKP